VMLIALVAVLVREAVRAVSNSFRNVSIS
jgi:hypothetical protein